MTKVVGGPLAGILLLCLSLAFAAPAAGGQGSRDGPILNACADNPEPGYWITRLAAEDPRIRVQAASTLGEMRAKAAIPALTRSRSDDAPQIRAKTQRTLERIGAQ